MKKIIKLSLVLIVVLFFSLYLTRYTNSYYQNNSILTEQAIEKYEKDLKEGKKIDPNNYKEREKQYNNNITKLGMKTSSIIEKAFKTSLKYMMKYLNKLEND